MIRLQNIGDGNFIDERAYISLEHFETLKKHEVRQGDIVIASLGNDLPRATIIPDLGGPAIVKADCIRFRPSQLVDPAWIVYALSAPRTKANVQERIRGIGRPRLGLGEIRKIKIPLPPLDEQRRIVSGLEVELSRVAAASRQVSRSLDAVENLTKSIRGNVLGNDSKSKPGKLGGLLSRIEAGKSLACEARPAREDEWGIVKVSAMTWGEFRENENKALNSGRDFDPRYEIRSGDILVSRANTREYVGAPVLVGKTRSKLLLSDKSLRLIPEKGVDRDWLIQLLSSPQVREQISERATGTKDSMRNISQKSLVDIEVMIPEASRQHELAVRVQENLRDVARLRSALLLARKRGDHLRQALLNAAFTGKLVPQDPADEPAVVLLERIRGERASAPNPKRARRSTAKPPKRLASTADVRAPADPQPVHAGEQTALEF
ncbi:restriction endonuclease subunit S [Nocardiopsis dassonvillei]|uniref:restriction endonuclease subunit S n=1 Tax=Nocardiopsis dassonvillei TaxID=2014 RepID=UPI0037003C44